MEIAFATVPVPATVPSHLPCPACEALGAVRGEGHPRFVAELRSGFVLLHPDQTHFGHVVFAAKHHVADVLDLAVEDREAFLADLALVMQAVRAAVGPRRLSSASGVDDDGHLAWHVVPRHADDPAPGAPFWTGEIGVRPDVAMRADLKRRLLRGLLAAAPVRRQAAPARGSAPR